MSDISDPAGAGRGDRKQARRAVDEAYAAGRISAVDRSLRMEQIDAASTRGDLAMVVRDLTDRLPEPPPAQRWEASAADVRPDPTPTRPEPPATTAASDDQVGPSWPPPGYAGRQVAEPPPRGSGNRRTIGCIVAVAAFVLLAPCLLALVGLVIGFAVDGGSDVEVGSGQVVGSDVEQWWGPRADELAAVSGGSVVSAYRVGADRGTATTDGATTSTDWTYTSGAWVEGASRDRTPTLPQADLTRVDAAAVQDAVDDALFAIDTDADPTVMVRVRPMVGQDPLLEVTVTDGATSRSRTYDSDGTSLG